MTSGHIFIRHPPLHDVAGRCYGRLDLRVDAGDIAAAAATLPALPALPILSSPAQRCLDLARAIAGPRPVAMDDRLQEMDFGDWEGQSWSALPRDDLDRWAADVAGFRPPGGECFHDVLARLHEALGTLRAPHLIVTHAGVIRAAQHALGGLPLLDAAAWPVPYCTPIVFR
jgi:alpha-ribazole phosphatase